MHRNQNLKTYVTRLFIIFKVFLCLSFFSFYMYLFAAVVDLLLGFLPVKEFLRKYQWHRQFLAKFSRGNFAASFSCTFLSVFVHFSGFIDAITLIWVQVERSFPLAELEYKWSQFWSNVMMPEVEQRLTLQARNQDFMWGGVLTRPKWTKLPKCIFYCPIRLYRKVAIHEKL